MVIVSVISSPKHIHTWASIRTPLINDASTKRAVLKTSKRWRPTEKTPTQWKTTRPIRCGVRVQNKQHHDKSQYHLGNWPSVFFFSQRFSPAREIQFLLLRKTVHHSSMVILIYRQHFIGSSSSFMIGWTGFGCEPYRFSQNLSFVYAQHVIRYCLNKLHHLWPL